MPLIVGYAQMIDIAVAPAAAFMTVRRVGSIGDTTCDCKSEVQQQILCIRGPNVRLFFVGRS